MKKYLTIIILLITVLASYGQDKILFLGKNEFYPKLANEKWYIIINTKEKKIELQESIGIPVDIMEYKTIYKFGNSATFVFLKSNAQSISPNVTVEDFTNFKYGKCFIVNQRGMIYVWTKDMVLPIGILDKDVHTKELAELIAVLYPPKGNNSNKTNGTPNTPSRISADIEDVSILHDQSLEEGIGMTIKMKLSVQGMKDKGIKVIAFFEDEYGNDIPCSNSSYSTTNNTLCAKNSSVATYENSLWNNFRVSVPYSMMKLKNGSNTIKFFLSVRDTKEGNTLFSTKYFTTTFNYNSSANDNCGKWPSMTSTTNGEYSPHRIKTYIEQPLGLTYGGSYQDCLRVINGYSGITPYLNTNKQIQVTKEGRWGIWFYGIAPIANVFFVNNGSTISYYNYIFPFPQSIYSQNEVKDFCRFMKQCASQYGYNLNEQSSNYYKASGYGNGKTVSIEMGTLDSSRYGVELKIVP